MIQGLLKVHPSKGRSEAELKELDDNDPMHAADYDLARLCGPAWGAAAAPPAPIFGAPGAAFGGFAAAAAMAAAASDDSDDDGGSDGYLTGSDGEPAHPAAPPGPPCFHCGTASWRTLRAAVASIVGFSGPRSATDFVRQALTGNDFERGVLEEWLAARGRALGDALAAILAAPNPEGVPAVRVQLRPPGGAPFGGPAGGAGGVATAMPEGSWTDLHACRGCGTSVLKNLIYSLRERIPDGELPARARGRRSCWYGRGCRTQGHKPDHASKLNHICEQTRFH